jgi:hypothetical protein
VNAEVIAALGTLAGLVTVVFAGVRAFSSDRFKQRVAKRERTIAEYEAIIRRLNEQHALDRAEWVQEKTQMRREWEAERAELREQIETLQAQVYALMHRPSQARTREDDR